jgi:hypothetical protein
MVGKLKYSWIAGDDRSITHVAVIGRGAFGEVHKVLSNRITD